MCPKLTLRSSMEYAVSFTKNVLTPFGTFKVLTWLITLDEHTRKIHLNAVTKKGLWSVVESYPFSTVTRAYQFMVRL